MGTNARTDKCTHGQIRQTHAWTNRPIFTQYSSICSPSMGAHICQYGNPGQNYITGKKMTLPNMKAKIFHADTVRGVTSNGNLLVQ